MFVARELPRDSVHQQEPQSFPWTRVGMVYAG